MVEKSFFPLPPSPSLCCEPIKAMPLRCYPAFALVPGDLALSFSNDQSVVETGTWTQASAFSLSVNQSPEPRKDSEDTGFSRNEITLFGFKIKVFDFESSLSVSRIDDHPQFFQNQNNSRFKKHDEGSSCDSRNGIRLFGVWISEEETVAACENNKLGLQENSRIIKKKRAYTRRLFKKRAIGEQNGERAAAGSYKEDIGELVAEKVLTKSDIDQSSRLLLSKETVEKRLIPILNMNYPEAEEQCTSLNGFRLEIFDADTYDQNGNSYTLVLKQWVTRSFVFTRNWKKDFVKRRNLKEDDQVGLFWDQNQRRFSFSVKQIRS